MATQSKLRNPSKSNCVTRERVMELLDYNPETGIFTRRTSAGGEAIGNIAGSLMWKGYREITIDRRKYRAHHLAWLIAYGVWPETELDHENRDRAANWIKNLREATPGQQAFNKKIDVRNKSGKTGVFYLARIKRYQAYIWIDKKHHNLGYFKTFEEAAAARDLKAKEAYGAFVP